MNSFQAFDMAQQVYRCGDFELACSADAAFPFFSPEGEREWVKGWDPQPIFPRQVVFQRDTVFRQGEGDEEALWTIVEADWQCHKAEYVRLAPASHSAHIIVTVETLGLERSRVVVAYTITTSREHTAMLEAFSEAAYATKMQNWQQWIGACLERRKKSSGADAPAV